MKKKNKEEKEKEIQSRKRRNFAETLFILTVHRARTILYIEDLVRERTSYSLDN